MTEYPLRFTVKVHSRREVVDGFGDVTYEPGPPRQVRVFAWHLGGTEGGPDGHVHRVDWDATVYAPADAGITAGDVVDLGDGALFDVDGPAESWEANPWWNPGLVVIRLKRKE